MNKNLDDLFEQARNSIKSEMPLEKVQQLIHGQASPSFWTNQKNWIMSTSIISVLIVSTMYFWNTANNEPKNTVAQTSIPPKTTIVTNYVGDQNPPLKHSIQTVLPDNYSLPIVTNEEMVPTAPPASLAHFNPTIQEDQPTALDSLGPKKTFTEYKLEIRKENSEQEIKKLKSELASYGIHMDIKELSYNNENKIKRFKGKFKTDSLFCGSTMNDYSFDISGSFKSMEFIFRVANNKNLKYLKIQSDNFEETIECYDDEVISSAQEAQKVSRQIQEEMAYAQEEMARTQEEMARVQEVMARAQEEMAQFQEQQDHKTRFQHSGIVDWEQIESDIEEAMENVEVELKGMNKNLFKSLKESEVIILNNNFKQDMENLKRDLTRMHIDIEKQVKDHFLTNKKGHVRTYTFENEVENDSNLNKSARQLEREAKELESAAKKLRKMAKQQAKEAKKNKKKNAKEND